MQPASQPAGMCRGAGFAWEVGSGCGLDWKSACGGSGPREGAGGRFWIAEGREI